MVLLSTSILEEHYAKYQKESPYIEIDEPGLNAPDVTGYQLHCALEESPSCQFQCETKEQLNKHIEQTHRNKNHLQCTVCNLYFRNINELSKHMEMAHKKSVDLKIKCNQCDMDFESEKEVKSHIRNMHKTHKPCKNFQLNQCQYAQDCSFRHIIL